MIVSTSHRFIYARVPKTASTSVSAALEPYRRSEDRAWTGKLLRRLGPLANSVRGVDFRSHAHWPLIAAKQVLGDREFARYFTFTVVRHPVDRMSSFFRHIRRHGDHPLYRSTFPDIVIDGIDFEAFIDSLGRFPIPSQASLIVDPTGAPLAKAAVRVERLDAELAPILERLGIAALVSKMNVDADAEPVEISPAARAGIETAFAVDYEQFGYASSGIERPVELRRTALSAAAGAQILARDILDFTPWERLPTPKDGKPGGPVAD